ncbi:sensor histidine kinase, partial [Mycolicibacterium porcinum]
MSGEVAVALALALILAAVAAVVVVRTRKVVATPTERAVHAALHTAAQAARALRQGLDTESAQTAAPYLRELTGTAGLALYDEDAALLARDDDDDAIWQPDTVDVCADTARESITAGRRVLRTARSTAVVAQPLLTEGGEVLGALVVLAPASPGPGMLGAVGEVARYAASQLELAELDASR